MNKDTLKLDFDAFLRSFKQNGDSPFAFLLGAGASVTSGIPSANDCIWDWKKKIYISKNPTENLFIDIHSEICRKKIQYWLDEQGIYPPLGSEEEYTFYAEKTYPLENDRTKYFENLCYNKVPYIGYKLLCLLQKYGVLRSVWTTNFDGLVERAAHQANITPISINLNNIEDINRVESKNELLYIALHGDYKYSKLKNTSKELDSQQPLFAQRLKSYFQDRNLIVVGYSGRDKSLMIALKNAFGQPGAGKLYWCGYGHKMSNKVTELLKSIRDTGRDAVYIDTDGFDKIMISLMLSCYNDDKEKIQEIKHVLNVEGINQIKEPFTLTENCLQKHLETNLYPVILPHDIFQFKISYPNDVKHWEFVKKLIEGNDIMAVPYKDKVYAFSYAETINNVFSDRIKGDIQRSPLSLQDIENISAFKSVVIDTLISGLSSYSKLQASISKRIIWDRKKPFNSYSDIFPAIKVDLIFKPRERYALMSICPTLYFVNKNGYPIERYKTIINGYLNKLRNKNFGDVLSIWERRIFNANHIKFDYPANSANHFLFQISSTRAFVGINGTYKNPAIDSNDKRRIYEGIVVSEPKLEFAGKNSHQIQYDTNPMRGLLMNNPYDYEFYSKFNSDVQIGVICPQTFAEQFSSFLNGLNAPLPQLQKTSDYVQQYKGFRNIFSCELIIPAINHSQQWITCQDLQTDSIALVQNICFYANKLSISNPKVVVVIFIPDSWSEHKSFKKDGESFDLHDYIKSYAAQHGFTTQIVEEKTIQDSQMKTEIYWWLSLALFVKSMRAPWALADLSQDTAYAGIGYSVKKDKYGNTNVVLGCSHIYNCKGQGLRYKLSKINNPIIDKKNNPYLSYEEAYKLGVDIQELFLLSMEKLPKRVVIHKRTPFHEDEIRGIKDALAQAKITNIDLITITMEESIRCIDQELYNGIFKIASYPVRRGICFPISDYKCLLWTHGTVDSICKRRNYYAGGRGIPAPLKITKCYGKGTMQVIAKEILGFTKMNWNSFNFYTKLPATIDTSNTLAQVGNLLSYHNGITYDYRYFI